MTAKTRTTLKGVFEDGDATSGSNFADLIDSFLSLSDTSAQSVTSPVTLTTVAFTTVSGANAQITTVSASAVHASSATIVNVDADKVSAQQVIASAGRVLATMSAKTLHVSALQINALATAAVSAVASANRFVQIEVSGTNYWLPLYTQN